MNNLLNNIFKIQKIYNKKNVYTYSCNLSYYISFFFLYIWQDWVSNILKNELIYFWYPLIIIYLSSYFIYTYNNVKYDKELIKESSFLTEEEKDEMITRIKNKNLVENFQYKFILDLLSIPFDI